MAGRVREEDGSGRRSVVRSSLPTSSPVTKDLTVSLFSVLSSTSWSLLRTAQPRLSASFGCVGSETAPNRGSRRSLSKMFIPMLCSITCGRIAGSFTSLVHPPYQLVRVVTASSSISQVRPPNQLDHQTGSSWKRNVWIARLVGHDVRSIECGS